MAKHKYLSNFDYFSLWFDAFFGLLDYDYTQGQGFYLMHLISPWAQSTMKALGCHDG
jgi:hypothetical protein